MCMSIFVCMYTYVPQVSIALRGQEKVLGPLELDLQMVVSCHVGAGNWTRVLWKSAVDAPNYWAISLSP